MKRALPAVAILLLCGWLPMHRVDEYLQAATLLVSAHRLELDLRLAPGSEVAAVVLDSIDLDRNGELSQAEQRGYALRVSRDLRVTLDGEPVTLALGSSRFDSPAALRAGTGELQLLFEASLPRGGATRHLVFANDHRPGISVYLVNSLVPEDPAIRISTQKRDYRQSRYELEYVQAAAAAAPGGAAMFWVIMTAGVVLAAADWLRRRLLLRS